MKIFSFIIRYPLYRLFKSKEKYLCNAFEFIINLRKGFFFKIHNKLIHTRGLLYGRQEIYFAIQNRNSTPYVHLIVINDLSLCMCVCMLISYALPNAWINSPKIFRCLQDHLAL